MSLKDVAAKGRLITLSDEERAEAASGPASPVRTAPGQLMHLQGTVAQQRDEIIALKKALQGGRARKFPVARCHVLPDRKRKLTAEQRAELKENLAKYPLAQPVSLELRPDGDWNVVAGNNRTEIYAELGREEIDGIELDLPPEQIEMVAFYSNLLSPSLSDFEKFWNFQRLQELTPGITQAELISLSGLSRTSIIRILSYEGLPAEALEALVARPERLGSNAAIKLAAAAKAGKTDQVTAAVRRLVTDEKYLQERAVKDCCETPKIAPPPPLTVKSGKRTFCEITSRGSVIGVRLAGKDEDAAKWAKEIREFIEQKLRSE
jgi:ParB family chromosome partitioning protein